MLQLACVWVNWVAIGNRLSVACADSVWIISWIVPGFSKWIYVAFCSSLDSTSTVICSVAFFYHDIVCGKFVLNAVLYNSYRHRILTVNNWRHWSFQPYMLRCLGFFPLQWPAIITSLLTGFFLCYYLSAVMMLWPQDLPTVNLYLSAAFFHHYEVQSAGIVSVSYTSIVYRLCTASEVEESSPMPSSSWS